MLTRSSGRRQQHLTAQSLTTSFLQLNLPWLAPAQLRWMTSHNVATTRLTRQPPRHGSRGASQKPRGLRQHATATDSFAPSYETRYPGSSLPPGTMKSKLSDDTNLWDNRLSELRPTNEPVILRNEMQIATQNIRVQPGIRGTVLELLEHLRTSLRIRRFDRARAIIQRMTAHSPDLTTHLLYAHHIFLEEALYECKSHPERSEEAKLAMETMQKWFEHDIRSHGIQPTAQMLVTMIKAAVHGMQGSPRDEAIRNYSEMAREIDEDVFYDVLYSEEYDDTEFNVIGTATSDFHSDLDTLPPDMAVDHDASTTPALEQEQDGETEMALGSVPALTPAGIELSRDRQAGIADKLPEVRATPQKGGGLVTVKKTLAALDIGSTLPADASPVEKRAQDARRQSVIEQSAKDIAMERWRAEDEQLRKIGINSAMHAKPIGALMWQWFTVLRAALEEELIEVKRVMDAPPDAGKSDERLSYGPYMQLLSVDSLAANTILCVLMRLTGGKDVSTDTYESSIKATAMIMALGRWMESEVSAHNHVQRVRARNKRTAKRVGEARRFAGKSGQVEKAERSSVEEQQKQISESLSWPTSVIVKLGGMLLSKLIETAQISVTAEHPRTKKAITQLQPAFLHQMVLSKGKRTGVISPNRELMNKLNHEPAGQIVAKRLPMIAEPRPWKGWDDGAYYHYPSQMVRLVSGEKSGKDYILAASARGDLEQVFAGLNALGSVAWRINEEVLRVQTEAWNTGEAVGNIAPLRPHFEVPPEPESSTFHDARRKWLMEMRMIDNKKSAYHSQRCFQNVQLEIARAMAGDTLYFPHSLDFRGRAYPIPPHLNHMGADNARALLMFNEGRELGEEGLRWLKIHLANVAGYDKASLQEREEFTMSHLDDIYDSARKPLEGRKWWLKSDDAWQTLAACKELTNALDSPDSTKFVSRLPIHQDGTCNGLQHYAALGGDETGAAHVNLEPGSRPADLYAGVADAVREEVNKDAAAGDVVAQALVGHISRKVVKQPVMTNVYGVTFYGAQAQVKRQLEEFLPNVRAYDEVDHTRMAQYVTQKIFKSLGTMFTGAQAIQQWLGLCVDQISTCLTPEQIAHFLEQGSQKLADASVEHGKKKNMKAADSSDRRRRESREWATIKQHFKTTIIWTTPLRLPVVQPYRATVAQAVKSHLQDVIIRQPQTWQPVNRRRQLQAFPPNFIHSLDATHMMLSALRCKELGLTFASIHDSFWTHACDVPRMSTVLRDAFVEMHSDDIVGRLREELQTRYKGCMYAHTIAPYSELGRRVEQLRKARSRKIAGPYEELEEEMERRRLLASEDKAERQKGEAMLTPSSLVEAAGVEAASSGTIPPSELVGYGIGEMPSTKAGSETEAVAAGEQEGEAIDDEVISKVAEANEDFMDVEEEGDVVDADEDEEASSSSSSSSSQAEPLKTTGTLSGRATKDKKKLPARTKVLVWLPVQFPVVPKKGGFDVKRLLQSKYFFH